MFYQQLDVLILIVRTFISAMMTEQKILGLFQTYMYR